MSPTQNPRKKRVPRENVAGGRNIPATPLNPKYHIIAWLQQPPGPTSNFTYTYAQLLRLVENQLSTRDIPISIPAGTASVFNFIEVCKVEAWSSPYTNPQGVSESSLAYTNIVSLDLTVGPTSAIMPRSTKADVTVGISERAFASVRGNPSTWGAKDSTETAVALDITRENAGDRFLPLTLKFHCNVW
jgi:hypothetical protein